jgi:hypothetical protein
LENLSGRPLLIANPDACANDWLNAWTAYHARHNQVYVANPQVNDIVPGRVPEAAKTLYPKCLPRRLFVLTGPVPGLKATPLSGRSKLVWSNPSFQLWQTANQHWALPLQVVNPNDIEQREGRPFFWVGQAPAELKVMAGSPGILTLHGLFLPGPSRPGPTRRRLLVSTNNGYRTVLTTREGPETVTVPIRQGKTTVFLRGLDRPTVKLLPHGETRILLVGVQDLQVQFTPSTAYRLAHKKTNGQGRPRSQGVPGPFNRNS